MSKSCHKKFLEMVTLTNNFGAGVEQLLRRLLSMLLTATAFCKMCQNMALGTKTVA
jgi:hypothetical protein